MANIAPARPGEINYDLVDRFTLIHGAVGFVMGSVRVPLPLVALAAIGWELIERPLKRQHPTLFPRRSQDSFQNAVGDALAMMTGYLIQQKLWASLDARRKKASASSRLGAAPPPYTGGR